MRLEVHGTKGTIRLIDDTTVEYLDSTGAPGDLNAIHALIENPAGFEDVEAELYNLYSVLRGEGKLGVQLEEGFHHLAFIVAALEAAETGKTVRVKRPEDLQ